MHLLPFARLLLLLEVDDRRQNPQPVHLTVSMWRAPEVKTGAHIARYKFEELGDAVRVVQRFDEGDYHCTSTVAAQISGSGIRIEAPGDTADTIIAHAGQGCTAIRVPSAASRSPQADVGETAINLLREVADQSYDVLRQAHVRWWSRFWSRTFVHIESPDGVGAFMAQVRSLNLYNMAATSRGVLPPKWNESLFITEGDTRHWGSQFWIWTTEMLYFPLFAADAIDLAEPYFQMYVKQLPDCERAAVGRKRRVFPRDSTLRWLYSLAR